MLADYLEINYPEDCNMLYSKERCLGNIKNTTR